MNKEIAMLIQQIRQTARIGSWSIGSTPKKNLKNMALDLDDKIKEVVQLDKDAIYDKEFEKVLPYVNMIRRAAGMEEVTRADYATGTNCGIS